MLTALRLSDRSPPEHAHGKATEYLTVRVGQMGYMVNGTEHLVAAGADAGSVRIEPGVPHTFWNAVSISGVVSLVLQSTVSVSAP